MLTAKEIVSEIVRNQPEDSSIEEIIKEIVDEGITVLLVEQNLAMVTTMAQRHYIMDQGRIVYHGTNDEFISNDEIKDRYLTLSSVERTI